MVLVSLAMASICFLGECHPVLVGDATPVGTFTLSQRRILDPGYGGDLLVYQEDARHVWAIHRVYTGNREQRRGERLAAGRIDLRRSVTNGCVNVTPEVYRKLLECCRADLLVIY